MTSLTAARRKHVTTTLGGHAGKESELANALDTLRLVCSLGGHASTPLRKSMTSRHKGSQFLVVRNGGPQCGQLCGLLAEETLQQGESSIEGPVFRHTRPITGD